MDNLTIAIAKGRIEKDIYRRLKRFKYGEMDR